MTYMVTLSIWGYDYMCGEINARIKLGGAESSKKLEDIPDEEIIEIFSQYFRFNPSEIVIDGDGTCVYAEVRGLPMGEIVADEYDTF